MPETKIRKGKTTYIVSSNFEGTHSEISQLLVVLKQLIKSRENQ